ncbi:MAG: tetratricopeptide repeat protein [Armatimonadota bacterium]
MTAKSFPRNVLLLVLTGFFFSSASVAWAAEQKDKENKLVEPTHAGTVIGQVYHAETGQPILGATVSIQQDGVYAQETAKHDEPSVDCTNKIGQYACKAEIGRVSVSIDAWRLLNSSVLGLMTGSAQKITRRIDVSCLNVRVTCKDYKTFEGVVPVRWRNVEAFTLYLEPVLLLPTASPTESTIATGWGAAGIHSVVIDPPIVKSGGSVKVTATVLCPAVDKTTKMFVTCASPFWKATKLRPAENLATSDGETVFTGMFRLPSSKKARAEVITFRLEGCPYDLWPKGGEKTCLVQIAPTPEAESAAQLRLTAYQSILQEKNVEAAETLRALCALPTALDTDYRWLAHVSEVTHDYKTAIDAHRHLFTKAPKKERFLAMGPYARLLMLDKQGGVVLSELAPEVKKVKKSYLVKTVPIDLYVAIGSAYLQNGAFEPAQTVYQNLTLWPTANRLPEVFAFRNQFQLTKAEEDLRQKPHDPQTLAAYSRVLMNYARWEEAIAKLQQALQLDPNLLAVQSDLGYALLRLRGKSQSGQSLDEAISQAEKATTYKKGKVVHKSKDFFAWHTLAILLYRKSLDLPNTAEAAQLLKKSRDTIIEALLCARSKDVTAESTFTGIYTGYYGAKEISICGFAYPEADHDFMILENLRILQQHPEDYLAYYNLASALSRLELPDIADKALECCLRLKSDFTEGKRLKAEIAQKQGALDDAERLLIEVLKANPRHPTANLTLAELYTEKGDMTSASACLVSYAQYYGAKGMR